MLVRIVHDLKDVNIFRQTPHNSGVWDGITFTVEDVAECDLLLCLSYPDRDITVECAEAWLLSQEPPARIRRWERDSYRYFDRVFANWDDSRYTSQPCTHWFPNFSYDEFVALKASVKTNDLSWVTSSNADLHGHKLRLKLLKYLRAQQIDYALFGRGFEYIADKAEGLLPYRYSLAIENFSTQHYWTEKIADCFLCWTIPLYWGATNIDEYFPQGSYLRIDPANPESVVAVLREAIANNYYEQNLERIAEARELVLNKYQLFPHINDLINCHFKSGTKRHYQIPKNIHPKRDSGMRKLRYKLNYRLSKHFNL